MVAWVAEAMAGERVDGIVMLAATLSPGYRLDRALAGSERGIVNFYSSRDIFMLGLGTKLFRTMDGEFKQSAGRMGFEVPSRSTAYQRLYQIPWNSEMSDSGNSGMHLTSGSEEFVSRYVAPLVLTKQWNKNLISRVVHGEAFGEVRAPGTVDDDIRERVR